MTLTPALQSLYQDVILEHHAHPRGAGPLEGATHEARHDNPLCGDRITLRLRIVERSPEARIEEGREGGPPGAELIEARYEADGCALSIASASLLASRLRDVTVDDARALLAEVKRLLGRGAEHEQADRALLGDLVALEGTRQFPSRIKCALLPWEALARALASPR